MDTIRTLNELLTCLQDTQSIEMSEVNMEANKHYYVLGYGDGLEAAIRLIQAAIRDEEKAEKEGI